VPADQRAIAMCWDEFTALTSRIAAEVIADGAPEILIGILRGGMIPAVMLAHVLGSRQVRAIEVTHTADDGINAAKTCRPLLRNLASAGDVSGRDVLITDDVAGTGETAAYTADLMRHLGAARVRTAVWVLNEANWPTGDRNTPDTTLTYIGTRNQGWVIFPWEQP
jgi:hypoxanthine phosphoribosyltransferase